MSGRDYADRYDPDADFDAVFTAAVGRRIARSVAPGASVLELGCATGAMTALLVAAGARVVAVEWSEAYLARLADRGLPGVVARHADVTRYEDAGRYDHVVASSLLQELDDPGAMLARAGRWLGDDGTLHVAVPNPESLHRQLAAATGLVAHVGERSTRDRAFATRRNLSAEELVSLADAGGLAVVERGGVFLKPYPNEVMARLPVHVVSGLEAAGETMPRHCAFTYLRLVHARA